MEKIDKVNYLIYVIFVIYLFFVIGAIKSPSPLRYNVFAHIISIFILSIAIYFKIKIHKEK